MLQGLNQVEVREKQMVGTANEAGVAEEAALWYQSQESRAMLGKVWESASRELAERGKGNLLLCTPAFQFLPTQHSRRSVGYDTATYWLLCGFLKVLPLPQPTCRSPQGLFGNRRLPD